MTQVMHCLFCDVLKKVVDRSLIGPYKLECGHTKSVAQPKKGNQ